MKTKKRIITHWRPHIRSRHPSHNVLRRHAGNLQLLPFKSIVRLGSTTELKESFLKDRIELNSIEAIKNSANKLRMKNCFVEGEVITADWFTIDNKGFAKKQTIDGEEGLALDELPFPIISKSLNGSRGRGNKKHDSLNELKTWLEGKSDKLNNYIFEKYYSYNREYRLHVSKNGCFYSCRKVLKNDAPEEVRWYRNNDHCNWLMESNASFDKPVNWDAIVAECVKALNAVGLDFGAVDLRVQSAKTKKGGARSNPDFIIVEINSAPSFGEVTAEKYYEELPKLLIDKHNKITNNEQ